MNAQMNSTFRGAAAQFLSKQHPITHQQVSPRNSIDASACMFRCIYDTEQPSTAGSLRGQVTLARPGRRLSGCLSPVYILVFVVCFLVHEIKGFGPCGGCICI